MIVDTIILGAGIAGASLAQALAPHQHVVIVEAEDVAGYHTTGRSNAFWHSTYGGPAVAPLTLASRAALAEGGFLSPRGAVTLAESRAAIDTIIAEFGDADIAFDALDRAALEALFPGLRPRWTHGLLEPDCFDIDVAGYHAACLASARRSGAVLHLRAAPSAIAASEGLWHVETPQGRLSAATLVNAAGAWADNVAQQAGAQPLGIQPYRRTIAQVALEDTLPPGMPFAIDQAGSIYFRAEGAHRLWLSPHDETPSPPCDAAPEEVDVAIAIDRLGHVTNWRVKRVERSWAGLRSFAPDRRPVYGYDGAQPGFFWCAGQGGFGIQTAPAAAALCASLILGDRTLCPDGVEAALYDPARLTSIP